MSTWPALLRVLLSIGLILNGSGYAVASTHMQMGYMATVALAPLSTGDPVTVAQPPCQHHDSGASAPATQLPDAASYTAPAKSTHPSPDCCKSGACRCACVNHAQAGIPAYSFRYAVIEHASAVRPLKPGHVTPALPHLIRPPIG